MSLAALDISESLFVGTATTQFNKSNLDGLMSMNDFLVSALSLPIE